MNRTAVLVGVLIAVAVGPIQAQELMPATASGWSAFAPRPEAAPGRDVWQGSSGYVLNIYGNGVPNVYGGWTTRIQGISGGNSYRFRARAVPADIASIRESVTIVLRWRGSFGDEVRPDYVWDYRVQADGSILFDRVLQAPSGTSAVDVQLILQWSSPGRVSFDALSFMAAPAPASRPVRVAAIFFRPAGSASGYESVQKAATYADQVASTHQPDVMVLGEMLNVIGAPGSLDSKAETVPGPSTDLMAGVARGHGVNIAFGILERDGTQLYNSAVLLDRNGNIVGKHRKVQLPLEEASAGVAPGDAVEVFDTDVGRVALLICQETFFPEPAREAALQGAEMLLVPIWGGKTVLVRARAAEHGMYLAASGYDYASEIVGPLGTVLDGVAMTGTPDVAIADVDLSQRFREVWLGDWRDISNKERRTGPYRHENGPTPPPPPPDTTPPTVAVTSPASGGTVSGSLTVAANASDNVGVARVRFFVDGAQLGSDDTVPPYSTTWDSRTSSDGSHTVTATAYDAANNSASSFVTVTVSNGSAPPPAKPVPGTIQAEDYDSGGEGVGYHDTTAGNTGGQYRMDGVDIERTLDTGGGYDVGWIAPTEWLNYTVSVSAAGTYTLTARVAANGAGGTFHVEFGGRDVTGPLTIPNTGGWQMWANVSATVTLNAGLQSMRVVFDRAGLTGVVGNVNYVRLDSAAPPPPTEVVLYSTDFTRHGAWVLQNDATAAGGQKMLTPDNAAPTVSTPLSSPADYVEASFSAPAGTSYTLWMRIRATADSKYNESVWVQYSDARANGVAVYPVGSTSGLLVNLENCSGCGVSGWGWQNRAYWITQSATVAFANSGTHVIRIQTREDGAQIDQVILSPSRYLSAAPGPVKNDTTIVPK